MNKNFLSFLLILCLGILGTPKLGAEPSTPLPKVLSNARAQTQTTHYYDPGYVVLKYPGGDVPQDRGVCTDVIIRAFRQAGVDLQVKVHRDMKANFSKYPQLWGLKAPDPNIDHRRVPNLMTFFTRQGKSLPKSKKASDYQPGDVVAWKLPNGRDHIGLVLDEWDAQSKNPLIIHNIGAGTQKEDILFHYKIIGHYRYF